MNTPERVPDDWYVGFHRGLAARLWRAAGQAMVDRDLPIVRELLRLPPGGSVLDVPCGDGRLATRLGAAGHRAIGIDISSEEVEHARRLAAAAGVEATFLAADMRDLPDVGQVDGVVCWGNSIGYLSADDTTRSFAAMWRALRPGGRLVVESLAFAETILARGLPATSEHVAGGVRMRKSNHYRADESRVEIAYVFEAEDGTVEHARSAYHVFTAGELCRMLRSAGFRAVDLYGEDGSTPFRLGASRLILVATA